MRRIISFFEDNFADILKRSRTLVSSSPENILYDPILPESIENARSFGGAILRSTAKIEQMCGGLTSRLWDDPFEWTLEEQLATSRSLIAYIDEVDTARENAFAFFKDDDELFRIITAPEEFRSVLEVLTDTLVSSNRLQERAGIIFQLVNSRQ